MGKGDYHIQSGGKGYQPPYKGHEAMCVVKQKGVNPAIGVGPRKVTEGKKANVEDGNKGSGDGSRAHVASGKAKHK